MQARARQARARQLGAYGEELAVRYLTGRGMTLLERNWRCDQGEIDVVLRDGDTLVVCEVKTRSSADYGSPHQALTAEKWERVRRLAARWMRERGVYAPGGVRIDLVAIIRPSRGPSRVEHVAGVC
jgi:putative endonuclease